MRCKMTDSQDTNRLQINGCKLEVFNGGNLLHSLFTLRIRLMTEPFSIRISRKLLVLSVERFVSVPVGMCVFMVLL